MASSAASSIRVSSLSRPSLASAPRWTGSRTRTARLRPVPRAPARHHRQGEGRRARREAQGGRAVPDVRRGAPEAGRQVSRVALDWSDPVAVSRWLGAFRVTLVDHLAVTDDMMRPPCECERGPVLHRERAHDTATQLRSLVDFATAPEPDDSEPDDGEPGDPAGSGRAGPVHGPKGAELRRSAWWKAPPSSLVHNGGHAVENRWLFRLARRLLDGVFEEPNDERVPGPAPTSSRVPGLHLGIQLDDQIAREPEEHLGDVRLPG
jgi:hypothetical protein